MEIKKFRILEWTSKFAGCPPRIEYELQSQTSTDPVQWETLGTSLTLRLIPLSQVGQYVV